MCLTFTPMSKSTIQLLFFHLGHIPWAHMSITRLSAVMLQPHQYITRLRICLWQYYDYPCDNRPHISHPLPHNSPIRLSAVMWQPSQYITHLRPCLRQYYNHPPCPHVYAYVYDNTTIINLTHEQHNTTMLVSTVICQPPHYTTMFHITEPCLYVQ